MNDDLNKKLRGRLLVLRFRQEFCKKEYSRDFDVDNFIHLINLYLPSRGEGVHVSNNDVHVSKGDVHL